MGKVIIADHKRLIKNYLYFTTKKGSVLYGDYKKNL